jgi:hypothetical protein
MLGASLKRKISRLQHPAHAQASSSDDEDPIGALGAYDRLLELSVCAGNPLHFSSSVPVAHETQEQLEHERSGVEACRPSRVHCMSTK